MADSKNRPVDVLRGTGGLSVSIFKNPSKTEGDLPYYNSGGVTRPYKDGDETKFTNSMRRDDHLVAAELLRQAWCEIKRREQVDRKKRDEE